MRVRPHPAKAAAAVTACVIGITLASAATADPPVQTLTPEQLADRHDCVDVSPRGNWSEATPLLSRPHAIKTSVYAVPGDGTALVRRGVNHATTAAIVDQGDLRMVCRERVPFGTRAAWS